MDVTHSVISRVSSMVSYYYISESSVGYHKNVANLVQRVEQTPPTQADLPTTHSHKARSPCASNPTS